MKIGILGGGQLGRMLPQAAANYPVETFVLENDSECPAAHLCHHFTKGDIRNFDDVYAFGKKVQALTIEIENVNIEALEKLEQEGIKVFPKPAVLRTIKNKILQKEYYNNHSIPTAEYRITRDREDLKEAEHFLPAVHKIGEGGMMERAYSYYVMLTILKKVLTPLLCWKKWYPSTKRSHKWWQ